MHKVYSCNYKAHHTRCNFDATLLHATFSCNIHATCCMQHSTFLPKMTDVSMSVGACGIIIALLLKKRCRRHHKHRTVWARQWIRNRQRFGAYHKLVRELRLADGSTYRNLLLLSLLK